MKPTLTAERLKDLLHYDPDTGVFIRRAVAGKGRRRAGTVAGTLQSGGYVGIRLDGRVYLAHRLAVLYMTGIWPSAQVDHRDRDRSNNRWGNLREATLLENSWNSTVRVDSASGLKGVRFDAERGMWRAYITVEGRNKHLGRFATSDEAVQARSAAETRYFGEFASV